ncbi:unnamed protein product [Rangifer tarandus platyrhynchus]|uniref:Uncharacterized protein n=2 Tax=Rangifer tarandus platyrhynchus TaxID=3082113 RepID=A0ABN8ZVA6_RANTA|nr:unnamed protein product [Rangifer tarandus platyrhynchus]
MLEAELLAVSVVIDPRSRKICPEHYREKNFKGRKKYFSSLQLGFCIFLPHLQQIPCLIPGFSLPGQNNLSTQVVTSWLNRAFQEEICLLVSFQPRTVEQGTQSALCPGRHGCTI